MVIYVMRMVMKYNFGWWLLFVVFIYHMKKFVLVSQFCDGRVFTLLKQIPFYFRFLIKKKLKKQKKKKNTFSFYVAPNTVKYFSEHFLECKQTLEKQTFSWKSFASENILWQKICYVEPNGTLITNLSINPIQFQLILK